MIKLNFFPAVNNEVQKEVQVYVNNFQMNSQWIPSVPSVCFSIIAGALSDEFGRKPLLLFPLIGDLIRVLLNIVNYAFIETLPLEFFYFDSIASFFGGSTVYYLGVYSYGTTVTKPEERSYRLARLNGIETLANVLGILLSPFVFRELGYFGNYAISCGFYASSILYLIFVVKEPIKRELPDQELNTEQKKKSQSSCLQIISQNITKVKNFLTKAIVIPIMGMKSVITKDRTTILKLLIILQFFCYGLYIFTAEMYRLTYLYMLLVFDGFNETDYALLKIVMSLLGFFCLMVIMPIFSGKLQIHDTLLLLVIVTCDVVSSAILPFVDSLWQFYLARGLGTIGYCKYSVVRSLLSKCIDANEVGKVFSLLAIVASIAPIGGNPLFKQLYNKTIGTFPGAIFHLFAALLFLAACGNLFMYFMRHEMDHQSEVNPNEQELEEKNSDCIKT